MLPIPTGKSAKTGHHATATPQPLRNVRGGFGQPPPRLPQVHPGLPGEAARHGALQASHSGANGAASANVPRPARLSSRNAWTPRKTTTMPTRRHDTRVIVVLIAHTPMATQRAHDSPRRRCKIGGTYNCVSRDIEHRPGRADVAKFQAVRRDFSFAALRNPRAMSMTHVNVNATADNHVRFRKIVRLSRHSAYVIRFSRKREEAKDGTAKRILASVYSCNTARHPEKGNSMTTESHTDTAVRTPVNQFSSEMLSRLIDAASAAFNSDRDTAVACITRAAELLQDGSGRETPAPGPASAPRGGLARWQANRVGAYIAENLTRRIRAVDLAKVVQLSPGHFTRAFRETFGETPIAYVARQRMRHAQNLMVNTRDSLSQIALACGLSDQSHFTRVFRRAVGMSPRAWRHQFATAPR
jgi:AraC family transcriptional regulator